MEVLADAWDMLAHAEHVGVWDMSWIWTNCYTQNFFDFLKISHLEQRKVENLTVTEMLSTFLHKISARFQIQWLSEIGELHNRYSSPSSAYDHSEGYPRFTIDPHVASPNFFDDSGTYQENHSIFQLNFGVTFLRSDGSQPLMEVLADAWDMLAHAEHVGVWDMSWIWTNCYTQNFFDFLKISHLEQRKVENLTVTEMLSTFLHKISARFQIQWLSEIGELHNRYSSPSSAYDHSEGYPRFTIDPHVASPKFFLMILVRTRKIIQFFNSILVSLSSEVTAPNHSWKFLPMHETC